MIIKTTHGGEIMTKESCCKAMPKNWAIITLIIGILYLGQEIGWWTFWTFSWWTVVFLMLGVCNLQKSLK